VKCLGDHVKKLEELELVVISQTFGVTALKYRT